MEGQDDWDTYRGRGNARVTISVRVRLRVGVRLPAIKQG